MNPRKYAIISFIVGVVSLSTVLLLSSLRPEWISEFLLKNQALVYGSIFILCIIGMILGRISIKSEKKIFAISGIIFSIIALLKIIPVLIFILFYGD